MRWLWLVLLTGCGLPVVDGAVPEGTPSVDDPAPVLPTGPWEAEDNDHPRLANPLGESLEIGAELHDGDVDCFSVTARAGAFLEADVASADGCPAEVMIQLVDPDGDDVATAWPDPGRGCSRLDPEIHEAARTLSATGTWTVCVRGLLGAPVPDYQLWVDIGDPCSDATLAPLAGC